MDIAAFSSEAVHLLVGAFATFCAILLWSRTRDVAWTLLIIAAIISYADIVLSTLRRFGVLEQNLFVYNGVPLGSLLLANLPLLLSGVGFLLASSRMRQP
jgi:hypothetical protein